MYIRNVIQIVFVNGKIQLCSVAVLVERKQEDEHY